MLKSTKQAARGAQGTSARDPRGLRELRPQRSCGEIPAEGTVDNLKRVGAASALLIEAGIDKIGLERALEAAATLLEAGTPDADLIVTLAWLTGVPAPQLAPVLRGAWAAGDPSAVRERLALLRNLHARAAGAARRALGVDPEDLLHQVEQLKASGEARSTRHALRILCVRLNKTFDYLRKRLRQARGDVSRLAPRADRDTSLPGSEGEGCNQPHRKREGAMK